MPYDIKSKRPEEIHKPEEYFKPSEYESPGMRRTQEELTRRALELLGEKRGRALDIGCGSGFSSLVLQDAGFDVKGIDVAQAMVDKARERGVDAQVASAEKLPFGDSEFNAVVSISAFQWVKDKARAAKEVDRVLKQDGVVVIQFYPESEAEMLRDAKAFSAAGFEGQLAVDNPANPRKRKIFLVLKKKPVKN
jgi:ubiquinone/menaquinone biosynthesis C-methylase UbiE